MKNKKFKLFVLIFFGVGMTGLHAQESISATGGNASGSSGSSSYSVGQVVYTTNSGTTGVVSQGVQQPFEILIVTGIEQALGINLNCEAYPNPTTDFLTLKVENYSSKNLSYQLVDVQGKSIESNKIEGNEAIISMRILTPAIYFLSVTDDKKVVKTFKIIKK